VRQDEAKTLLAALGMPAPQQNDNAVYTLLAFADVGPKTAWSAARSPRLTPHDVIQFTRARYRKNYAENTRETIGVPVTRHDKLADVVLYDGARGWLFLVEAVTTHGPVSPKRHAELEKSLAGCKVGRVYISAFPAFREFKKYAAHIAWETEVWIAEAPDHLLHYNGDRFIGPR